jgi:hypothetical protein
VGLARHGSKAFLFFFQARASELHSDSLARFSIVGGFMGILKKVILIFGLLSIAGCGNSGSFSSMSTSYSNLPAPLQMFSNVSKDSEVVGAAVSQLGLNKFGPTNQVLAARGQVRAASSTVTNDPRYNLLMSTLASCPITRLKRRSMEL